MNRTKLTGRNLAVGALLIALAGCGTDSASEESAGGDCGRVVLGQSGSVPAANVTCLTEAAEAGVTATLSVSRPTEEGDPIVTTYTVVGPGKVTKAIDTRADSFGPRAVTEYLCDFRLVNGQISPDPCSEN